ncbi:MAG: hypothetical protein RLZZ337_52 [Bacteroidota bacterium]|jgi:HD superfamily phosphodiesterase
MPLSKRRNIRKLKAFVVEKIQKEIPATLTYHGLHHTLDVLRVCNDYIKRLSIQPKDAHLLRTAALMHDIGIMWNYQNHEEQGMDFVRNELPKWDYSQAEIERVCGMIQATRIPQNPMNILEQIICDADLDYLGTDQFYSIGETLFKEFIVYGVVKNEKEWDQLQINFLTNHSYHTDFAKRNRQPVKMKYLNEIKAKWNID